MSFRSDSMVEIRFFFSPSTKAGRKPSPSVGKSRRISSRKRSIGASTRSPGRANRSSIKPQ